MLFRSDELEILAHLVLVFDLAFGLENLDLVRNVLRLQLFDLSLFLLQLVKHIL